MTKRKENLGLTILATMAKINLKNALERGNADEEILRQEQEAMKKRTTTNKSIGD